MIYLYLWVQILQAINRLWLLVQVNGTDVVGHKHDAVVDMIRDSSHVTLTIIGKKNGTKTLPLQSQSSKTENSHKIEVGRENGFDGILLCV